MDWFPCVSWITRKVSYDRPRCVGSLNHPQNHLNGNKLDWSTVFYFYSEFGRSAEGQSKTNVMYPFSSVELEKAHWQARDESLAHHNTANYPRLGSPSPSCSCMGQVSIQNFRWNNLKIMVNRFAIGNRRTDRCPCQVTGYDCDLHSKFLLIFLPYLCLLLRPHPDTYFLL